MSNKNKNEALAELLNKTGGFSRHQLWLFFLMSIISMLSGQIAVQIILMAKNIPHRCKVADCDTANSSYSENFLNFTTPFDNKSMTWDSCHTYSAKINGACEESNFDTSEPIECSEWIYDTSVFKATAVSEFNIVCNEEWKQPLPNSCVMLGMLIGAVLLGGVADRLGRRKTLVIALLVSGIGQAISAVVFDFYSLLVARTIVGIGDTALFQISFVLLVEQSSLKRRNFYGLMIEIPFAFGEATVAILAFLTRSWRPLQGTMAVFTLTLASFYYWCTPESIRWLQSKKDLPEIKREVQKIINFNKKGIEHYEKYISVVGNNELDKDASCPDDSEKLTRWQLFKYPNLAKRFLKLCYVWFAINMCYYGLTANSVNLGGDVFVNFASVMLIEVPAFIFAYFIIGRCGKKGSLLVVLIFGGLSCIASGLLTTEWLITSLSMAGKFGASAGFAIVFIYSAEVFPTPTRAICLGACSTCGRTGAIIAPFISYLATYYQALPLLVFGTFSLLAGFLMFFLPETMGAELPQTIEESENFGKPDYTVTRNQTIFQFSCCSKSSTNDPIKEVNSVESSDM